MKKLLFGFILCFCAPCLADTLYQANIGGYTGAGFGVGVGTGYAAGYQANVGYGYGTTQTINGIPYEGPNYPFSQQCCGCNNCNSCGNSYGCGR